MGGSSHVNLESEDDGWRLPATASLAGWVDMTLTSAGHGRALTRLNEYSAATLVLSCPVALLWPFLVLARSQLDTAALTGEPFPRKIPDPKLSATESIVLSGFVVRQGEEGKASPEHSTLYMSICSAFV